MLRQSFGIVARRFSAEAAAEVKIPAQAFGVAGKYATALYVSAFRANKLEAVEKELRELAKLDKENQTFSSFLRDPSVSKETRVKAIEDVLGQAQYTDVTKNCLALLADGGRLSFLPKIISSYEEILMAHRGEVKASVTAALELTPEELSEVTQALKGMLKPGQSLKLTQKVDRSIMGGLVVDIGDKHIDLSIRSRMRQVEKLLSENL